MTELHAEEKANGFRAVGQVKFVMCNVRYLEGRSWRALPRPKLACQAHSSGTCVLGTSDVGASRESGLGSGSLVSTCLVISVD